MSMFSLNSNDTQSMGRRMLRRPYMLMRRGSRRMERRVARAVGAGTIASANTNSFIDKNRSEKPANANKEQRKSITRNQV